MSIFLQKEYRHILILESRNWWGSCRGQYDPERDLVLTYDMALRKEIELSGGEALYVDHLVDRQLMHEDLFPLYRFFREWHVDSQGEDIFNYRGIPFGFSFRIEIWNDMVSYVRNRLCLEMLRTQGYERLFVGTELGLIESLLDEMGLDYSRVQAGGLESRATYYFPIHRWMDEKLRTRKLRHRVRDAYTAIHGTIFSWLDRLSGACRKPTIFVQEYYPTREILQRLKADPRLRLVQVHYSWQPGKSKYLLERTIPIWGNIGKFTATANGLMQDFRKRRHTRLVMTNGLDLSDGVYRIIDERISARIAEFLRTLDCVIRYLDRNPLALEILISNIGVTSPLIDCVCKQRNIPSYMVINGLLGGKYLDEGKHATYINSYSVSIREHYFWGMDNVACLGDPRMDAYAHEQSPRQINRNTPAITIGASAHSNTDMNSYLAVEFDFLYDVLQALRLVKEQGVCMQVGIKVRSNGYRMQYEAFVSEYYPDLAVEILDGMPIIDVLRKTDFYISTFSQTVIEASSMGIPSLYYKKDCQYLDPPFDGNSEVVTVDNVADLVTALDDFYSGGDRYDSFLRKPVLEKYVGPLDGGNLERNLQYIYQLLGMDAPGRGA